MKDWREVGRQIRDRYLTCEQAEQITDVKGEEKFIRHTQRFVREVQALSKPLLENCILNNPDFQLALLRSGAPLDAVMRAHIAKTIETALCSKPKPGHPKNEGLRQAAHLALAIYYQWKAENAAAGINDHGLGHQMKDLSCDYAMEFLGAVAGPSTPDKDAVRDMMDRSIHRQN